MGPSNSKNIPRGGHKSTHPTPEQMAVIYEHHLRRPVPPGQDPFEAWFKTAFATDAQLRREFGVGFENPRMGRGPSGQRGMRSPMMDPDVYRRVDAGTGDGSRNGGFAGPGTGGLMDGAQQAMGRGQSDPGMPGQGMDPRMRFGRGGGRSDPSSAGPPGLGRT